MERTNLEVKSLSLLRLYTIVFIQYDLFEGQPHRRFVQRDQQLPVGSVQECFDAFLGTFSDKKS